MNLLAEVVRRSGERAEQEYGDGFADGDWAAREATYLGSVVADVLDILTAEGRISPAIEPGLCWSPAAVMWPGDIQPRCELRAGHAGAHECDRGSMGGTAVWTDEPTPPAHPRDHETGASA